MQLSLGMMGALGTIFVPLIVGIGFSEACANEVWTMGVTAALGVAAWYGRYRLGDVKWYGARK